MPDTALSVVIRGRAIRFDSDGLACLNDIWSAAGFSKNQKPYDWMRLPSTMRLVEAVAERVTGKSRNWTKNEIKSVTYTKAGVGSYADVRLALAYAEYLNPKLALEVREVFLRFKAADPTLADDVLQRASTEANEWAGTRALGRVARKEYVDSLLAHDVSNPGIGRCTNGIYQGLFKTTAAGLRRKYGMKSGTPRDKFSTADLAYTMAAEMLAKEDIEESNHRGDATCHQASVDAARAIGSAIEQNRIDRKRQGKLDL